MSLPLEALAVPEEGREKIRAALLELRRAGADVTLSAVQRTSGVKRAHVSVMVGLHRKGLTIDAPWTDAPPAPTPAPSAATGDLELEALALAIEAADSAKLLSEAAGKVARFALQGRLDPAIARVLRDLIQERRRGVADARQAEPPEPDEHRMLLASAEAVQVARAFDYLCNGWRRRWVEEALAAHLNADLLDFPNLDGGGPAQDPADPAKQLGLDAWGRPPAGAPWPAWCPPPQVPGPAL